ncbi:GNAT family N-acetyltransferase [Halobacillus shinanisalinarum]|uniref:GNAT family N-acetyltransferase n=1 Tax=Halobacillus shinanisalinarum TaxID=2932258 RepID=A0ABY4GVI7_9BACI|nr:GNAT family N-acetyltransferase [Halobacillus shinanisalinarum]UOQ92187.1 GNAT family N-acetyltransferase [Halobacillus shinanisalinarum]
MNTEDIELLESCLIDLANYHNSVAQNFKGIYPLKTYRETLDDIKKQVRENSGLVYGVLLDGSAIGFCKISFEGKNGKLDYLYVNKEYRGEGYGRLLMEWAMSEFQKNKIHMIDLKIVEGNPISEMYKKYGFEPRLTVMTKINKE